MRYSFQQLQSPGESRDYVFEISSPVAVSIQRNSRVFIEFENRLFPPRLNSRQGYVDCNVNQTYATVCEVVSERRLSVIVPLNVSAGASFVLRVNGVTQPCFSCGYFSIGGGVSGNKQRQALRNWQDRSNTIFVAISQTGLFSDIVGFTRVWDDSLGTVLVLYKTKGDFLYRGEFFKMEGRGE